jgi:hypothetical protein
VIQLLLICLLGIANAAQITISVGSKDLVVGQTVELTVQVINGSPKGLPELPTGPGLRAQYLGQAQQHVVSNFKSTRVVQFNYRVTAVQAGRWPVGPVDLIVDGQRQAAAPITLSVGEAPQSQGGRPVVASLSDAAPFLGEVVVYRLQYKRSRPIVGVEWTRPSFDGFIEEKVAEPGQREYQIVEDGRQYTIQTVEIPLVAASVGPHTVPPAVVTARYRSQRKQRRRGRGGLDDLFGNSALSSRAEIKNHTSLAQEIEVRPLPVEGRPVDFGGLVGAFALTAEASGTQVELGESVTLTYRLQGVGTLHGFRLPPAPSDGGFRAYDDSPEIAASLKDGVFLATGVVKRAVVPEAAGVLTVPGLSIPVFDPRTEQYTTLNTLDVRITVLPGEEGAGKVTSFVDEGGDARRAVASLGEDIMPLTAPDRLQDATILGAVPLLATLPGVPLLIWLALIANTWLDGRRVDPMVVQRRRLITLPAAPEEQLAVLEDIFREVAGIRLGLPAPALDLEAVAGLSDEAARIYRALERARYGGLGAGLDELAGRVSRFVEGT